MQPISTTALNADAQDISLMSYNILLPNTGDGWWVSKYYDPDIPPEDRDWESRIRLFREQFSVGCDLLTLQEVNQESYREDLAFLLEDYELLCHSKARIAMVTGWKRDRFEVKAEYHRNRSLIVVLKELHSDLHIAVANCHLSAGRNPRNRFQQIHAAVSQLEKEGNKYNIALFILAGDFNSNGSKTAVHRFLEDGILESRFREERYPNVEITSQDKTHRLGNFLDCYAKVQSPGTLWARNSAPLMMDPKTDALLPSFVDAIRSLYEKWTAAEWMTLAEMEAWILNINGALRGSEYRSALEMMDNDQLSFEGFLEVYRSELLAGKHWAIHHDLAKNGIFLAKPHPFVVKFPLDMVWIGSQSYECTGVVMPVSKEAARKIEAGDFPPNRWQPSDHFPLMVRFSPDVFAGM